MEESVSFARHYCGCQDVGSKPLAKLRSGYTIMRAHKWVLARPFLSHTEKGAPPLFTLHQFHSQGESLLFTQIKSHLHHHYNHHLSLHLLRSNVSRELDASPCILVGCDLALSLGNLALLAMPTTF